MAARGKKKLRASWKRKWAVGMDLNPHPNPPPYTREGIHANAEAKNLYLVAWLVIGAAGFDDDPIAISLNAALIRFETGFPERGFDIIGLFQRQSTENG